jgi:hypothetical protein
MCPERGGADHEEVSVSPPSIEVPRFDRKFFDSDVTFSRIGDGEPGGKARSLMDVAARLRSELARKAFPGIQIDVPRSVVVMTDVFDAFIQQNGLDAASLPGLGDDRIRHAFLQADLPGTVLGDLRALVESVHRPLAVRSSSRLEDALGSPFAGVYATKMTPNNQLTAEARFGRLVEAIKTVYASTFFASAVAYLSRTDAAPGSEKMAVLIQEVVGERHGDRFYPECSGVGRSYNFYPFGDARPEDGVVELALGLGKSIVDGEVAWRYSPAHPKAPPPFGSIEERLAGTQLSFWAVNMGRPPEALPMAENEYLVRGDLRDAEQDDTLAGVASTVIPDSGLLVPGTGRAGPRVVDFGPLLSPVDAPFNDAVTRLLEIGERTLGHDVEIEFAWVRAPRDHSQPDRLALLQLRPTLVRREQVAIADAELNGDDVVVATDRALGNGVTRGLRDVIYVRPDRFDPLRTREIAADLGDLNRDLVEKGRPYLLIGFGRWGSSDPSLGIPVDWAQISGAGCIVEATLTGMNMEFSQGSHFFHNITSFGVSYLMVRHQGGHRVDWAWLDAQPAVWERDLVRHVRLARPVRVRVDGRTGRGIVSRTEDGEDE